MSDPPVLIAVMGATGTGKTSFVNMASGSDLLVGRGLESCTSEVEVANAFTLDGRQVVLIDTPGFDDTNKRDSDILDSIARFLASTYDEGYTLAGVIYIHRITEPRFTGTAGENFRMFRKLCGDSTLNGITLVTNVWGEVSQEVGEEREEQLASIYFKPALDKGASMARHLNTVESAHDIIRGIIAKRRQEPLQIQHELVNERKTIHETAAGEAVNEDINKQIQLHQAEIARMNEERERAIEEQEWQTRQEFGGQMQTLQYQAGNAGTDLETMTSRYEEEREWADYEAMREQEKREKRRRRRKRFWTAAAVVGTVLLL